MREYDEELMPIGESVPKVFLEAALSVFLVFSVLSFVILLNASYLTIAFLTFAVGLAPKNVTVYLDGRRQRNLKPVVTDAQQIAKEYINSTKPCEQRAVDNRVLRRRYIVFVKVCRFCYHSVGSFLRSLWCF